MKTISHGKDILIPRQKKMTGFFIFARLLTTFSKSFRRTGQVQIEYLVLFAVISAVVITSLVAFHTSVRDTGDKMLNASIDAMSYHGVDLY
ncbi:MAG: hypothetical protein ABH954_04695 [Candidatus Omnitrophota bacterium]